MKQAVIKLILKLLGKVLSILGITSDKILDKIFKKKKMGDDKEVPQVEVEIKGGKINANTQIVFTVKGFLATIGSILTIFYFFYTWVIVPKFDASEKNYMNLAKDQKEQNTIFYQEISKINVSFGSLSATVNAMNNNRTYVMNGQNLPNTGGSFETTKTTTH
jgi:hypothetical protein